MSNSLTLQQILKVVIDNENATDLHIVTGSAPVVRIGKRILRIKSPDLTSEDTKRLCYSILTDKQKAKFEETKELDFSFGVKNSARFRGNLFYQKGAVSGTFRRIPYQIPKFEKLGLPPSVSNFTNSINGLILITGPTGSGKTTTIASLIDKINSEHKGHIITIEDPIEYIHEHKQCIINQRELGADTWSYQSGVKHLLRQDPDYCLIGELRDLETIEEALRLSETGHLVFATLHTNSAIQTVSRIVTVFPSEQQNKVRVQISFILVGVVAQQLLPGKNGGLELAYEVLVPTPAIRNLIRENKLHQIYSNMQMGQSKTGMQTMNQSLLNLILKRKVEIRDAFASSPDPEELDQLLKKAGL